MVWAMIVTVCGMVQPAEAGEAGARLPAELELSAWHAHRSMSRAHIPYVYDDTPAQGHARAPVTFFAHDRQGVRLDHASFARAIGDTERASEITRLNRRYTTGIYGSLALTAASMIALKTAPPDDLSGETIAASAGLLALSGAFLVSGCSASIKLWKHRYALSELQARETLAPPAPDGTARGDEGAAHSTGVIASPAPITGS